MCIKNLTNIKIALPFIFSFFSLVSIFFYEHFFDNNSNEKKIIELVQNQILVNDLKSYEFLSKFIINYNSDSTFPYSSYSKYSNFYNLDDFLFFILNSSDSILFWSDNSVPLTFLLDFKKLPFLNSGNGWYRLNYIEKDSLFYISAYLLKHEFIIQNDYLINSFSLPFEFAKGCSITLQRNGNDVFSKEGNYLFSIIIDPIKHFSNQILLILFSLFIIFIVLFIVGLYFLFKKIFENYNNRRAFIFSFVLSIILFRIILLYKRIPFVIYSSELFSPKYYAYSDFFPSVGDFFIHSIFLLVISLFLFKIVKFDLFLKKRKTFYKFLIAISVLLHVFIFYKIISFSFETIILDSKISLDFNDIFSLSLLSIICYLIIGFNVISYFLVTSRLSYFSYKYSSGILHYIIHSIITFIICVIINLSLNQYSLFNLLFVLFYILSLGIIFKFHTSNYSIFTTIFFISFFSIISAYFLHNFNSIKERNNRTYLATQLLSEQHDPIVEFQFSDLQHRLFRDSTFFSIINYDDDSSYSEFFLENYLIKNYLTGFWKKYDVQITCCKNEDLLNVKPDDIQINCLSFFNNLKHDYGTPTPSNNYFLINYENGDIGYLGIIDFVDTIKNINNTKVFIEIIPRYFSNFLGFPELLIDKEFDKSIDLNDYSYAKYHNFRLHKRVGSFYYNNSLDRSLLQGSNYKFFNDSGYNHLFYKSGFNNYLIISIKNKTYFEKFSPFSYFFVFYFLLTLFIYIIFNFPFSGKKFSFNLLSRLQFTMVIVILFSFLSIGIFSISYIVNLNTQKNKDILIEKTHSVLVELEHKLSNEITIEKSHSYLINYLLIKFSEVFFTDIIIYDLNGNMIGSSRPQIFSQKLISEKMNSEAFFELSQNNKSFFIQNENIGHQRYFSAYIPFINNESKKIAFLNLPYFARENDLKREISNFLVTYLNIYVILIVITVVFGFIISNYISRPLKLILNKIGQIKLGKQNEKISWYRDDEIGKLVFEYNRMIDEITVSTELLARTEREYAWREMAKQVAHEIKNPLTPMKLGVQHIQRAFDEQVPDLNKRIQKFTQIMIDQIDTLSSIASEFSDFAKMPATKKEFVNVSELIQNSIILFKNYDNISFSFQNEINEPIYIFIDKEQLLRVFNNLFKNSIQAIGDNPNGKILIVVKVKTSNCEIEISDNGVGILSELHDKIFSPNFTTKSGGMGLGLAISKSIIDNSDGEIRFTSSINQGTTFLIKLPIAK